MPAFSLARRLRAGETVYCRLVRAWLAHCGRNRCARRLFRRQYSTCSTVCGISPRSSPAIGAIYHAGASPVVRVPLNDFAIRQPGARLRRRSDHRADDQQRKRRSGHSFPAAKYPPLGERSWGPIARHGAARPARARSDYLREANDGTLTLAMIETPAALANVDAIAATPGIDALFIGPYDLSTSLSGGKAQDVQAPEVERAIDQIGAAAKKAGKIAGIYCRDAERALAMAKRGFRFMAVGSDHGFLREGLAPHMKALKG